MSSIRLVMIIFGLWQVVKGSIIRKHTSYIRKERYNNWGLAISLFIFFLTVWSMNANDFNMNTLIYIGILLGVLSIYITFMRRRNTKLTIYNIDEKKVIDIFDSILKSHGVDDKAEIFIELDNSSMYT